MNPKTLRKLANMDEPLDDYEWFQKVLLTAADAWEADISLRKEVEKVARESLAALRKRLEAARIPALRLRDMAGGTGREPPFEDWIHRAWVYERAQNILAALAGEEK